MMKNLLRGFLIVTALQSSVIYAAPNLDYIQIQNLPDSTRATFTLSEKTSTDVFTLDHPERVVMDFANAQLRTNLKKLPLMRSGILQIRSGYSKNGTLRIVFNMDSNVIIKKFLALDNDSREMKLIVEIFPKNKPRPQMVTPIKQRIASAPKPKPEPPRLTPPETNIKPNPITVVPTPPVPKPISMAPKPVVATPAPTMAPKPVVATPAPKAIVVPQPPPKPAVQMSLVKRPTVIVIDAGHGGKDPGTVGKGGAKEKDVVLAIALNLAQLINKEPNMRAIVTREGDYFLSLQDRLHLAHKAKGDLFIAIHADSYFNNIYTGASVYALSRHGATTESARWLAKRENYSELGGVDLAEVDEGNPVLRSVLMDLTQTATISDSLHLGVNVLQSLQKVTTLHYPHVAQAPFVVLKSPDIPSILVETGFLSNPHEEERLRTKAYRDKLANAILLGLRDYLKLHPTFASNAVITNKMVT